MAKLKNRPDPLKAAKALLSDFPATYDAHRDSLSEKWDHAQNVNNLMKALRDLVAATERSDNGPKES